MKRIVIIGAGPAGLTAAAALLAERREDEEIIVLEVSDAVGGLSRTVNHHGNRMDLGGHRFFSKDERVVRWWHDRLPVQGAPSWDDRLLGRTDLLAPGGPDPAQTDRVMLRRQRVSRIYFGGRFFDYPVSLSARTLCNLGFSRTLRAGTSYLHAAVRKLPETSLENFYINRFGRTLYSLFFEGYTEKLWGRHPRDIAADWGAQRVKGLSVAAVLRNLLPGHKKQETSLITAFDYPKHGPGQLWDLVAAEVEAGGGRVVRGAGVTAFERDEAGVVTGVVTRDAAGAMTVWPADVVISSMPLRALAAGLPGVPKAAVHVARGLPYRDFVTVGLLVERLALRNETRRPTLDDRIPDCWLYVQDPGVTMGRIQVFNNWSPYLVDDPRGTVWLGLEYFCDEDDALWNRDDAAMAALAADELRAMGVLAADTPVLDAHCERVPKAYPAYFNTYDAIDTLTAYLDTVPNLYCIGRNGQHRYNNMDHSMVTAFEAVRCIRTGDPSRAAVWGVNTEQEYHEEQ